MDRGDTLDLGIATDKIRSHEDYRKIWEKIAPVEVKMIEKNERCKHDLGESYVYRNHYERPKDLCPALAHVLDLYIFRVSIGFPSWEDDPLVHKIHCPDKKGTVWQLRRLNP
jgi:uncharacterized repeat protein (TIGR04076 family)